MSKKVKIFAIVVVIIIVLILAFTYLGGTSATDTSAGTNGLSSSVTAEPLVPGGGGAISADMDSNAFSTLLASINGITLDTSVFSNAGYKALRDYPITLGTAIIGRQNPFAPLGVDSSSSSSSQNATPVTVQTLTPSKVSATSAQLGALVIAQSTTPTTVIFNYGTNDTFGSATAPVNVTKSGTALFTVTGLTAATTYYIEAVAVQGSTTATGTTMSFTTPER